MSVMAHFFNWILVFSLGWAALQSNGPARLYLEPAPLQDERLLVVDVMLADVENLYGADVQLEYDPGQLQVQDAIARLDGVQVTPGSLLPDGQRLVLQNIVATDAGRINFAATLLNPAPPINGAGPLATITFRVVGPGPYTVAIDRAELVTADLGSVAVTTENLEVTGGLIETAPAVPAAPAGGLWWGWIGLAVLLAGLVTLTLIALPRLNLTPATAPNTARPIPRTARSAGQSSALLAEQGQRALEQGSIETAYELFSQAIELDPGNARAWLGKGKVAQQDTEKRICFQRVLALDPHNAEATTALNQIQRPSR